MKKIIIFALGIVFLCSIVSATKITQSLLNIGQNSNINSGFDEDFFNIFHYDNINDINYLESHGILNGYFYNIIRINDSNNEIRNENFVGLNSASLNSYSNDNLLYSLNNGGTFAEFSLGNTQNPYIVDIFADLSTPYFKTAIPISFTSLNGSGNAFACLDSSGKIYRSDTACA